MKKKKEIKIEVIKLNSSTFQLTKISSSLIRKLSDKFSYLPPGYIYSPMYRLRGVNACKVRLVKADGTFPMGLFVEVMNYLIVDLKKKVKIHKDVKEHFYPLNEFFKDDIKEDIFSNFEFDGNPVKLRDYQLGAVKAAFEYRNGLLNLSTGAGKCLGGSTLIKVKLPKEIIKKYKKNI